MTLLLPDQKEPWKEPKLEIVKAFLKDWLWADICQKIDHDGK